MRDRLLKQFEEFLEKQDLLSKRTEHESLHHFGYSEIHVIAAIGDLEQPNVTTLAQALNITKGAVSKITKKLLAADLIASYLIPPNKQKIYFRLTDAGQFLYAEHAKRHALWLTRDKAFLQQFSEEQLDTVLNFMRQYNRYLEENIQILGGESYAD